MEAVCGTVIREGAESEGKRGVPVKVEAGAIFVRAIRRRVHRHDERRRHARAQVRAVQVVDVERGAADNDERVAVLNHTAVRRAQVDVTEAVAARCRAVDPRRRVHREREHVHAKPAAILQPAKWQSQRLTAIALEEA
jgi:hypothetical protein